MAETADDLSTPLGQKTVRRKRRFRLPFTVMQALAVLLGLFLVTFAGFALFNENPLGGEPITRVAIRLPAPAEEKTAPAPSGSPEPGATPAARQAVPSEQRTVTIIDGSSGKRQDVTISGDGSDKAETDAAPAMMAGVDQRLLEKSRYGMIPMASDGLKPFTVYAADADRVKAAKIPVVAIVVGGLGVGAAKTADAIVKLPPAVTLAFTPYGSDPTKLAERARAQRHDDRRERVDGLRAIASGVVERDHVARLQRFHRAADLPRFGMIGIHREDHDSPATVFRGST